MICKMILDQGESAKAMGLYGGSGEGRDIALPLRRYKGTKMNEMNIEY
jgi:hypothetical protein